MKKRLIFCLVSLCASILQAANGFVVPPFLVPGDTVAIISPSSEATQEMVDAGSRALRKWGLVPIAARNVLKSWHGYAGTPQQRRDDLLWALRNPSVKAIIATRGGDGAPQMLAELPVDSFARYPKWIIGFSDVTALLCAEARAGVMSVHGSMCEALGYEQAEDTVSRAVHDMLFGKMPVYRVPANSYNHRGVASGTLVGGNMSVYGGLVGSPFDILDIDNIILFIEDTGENMSHVARMLHMLELRGVLGRLKGLIVGKFSKYKKPDQGFEDMYHMLSTFLKKYPDLPVCFDFPVGHAHLNNFPMMVGAQVQLEINSTQTTLRFINPN